MADVGISFQCWNYANVKNMQISNKKLTLIFPAAKQMFVVQSPAFVPVTSEI